MRFTKRLRRRLVDSQNPIQLAEQLNLDLLRWRLIGSEERGEGIIIINKATSLIHRPWVSDGGSRPELSARSLSSRRGLSRRMSHELHGD